MRFADEWNGCSASVQRQNTWFYSYLSVDIRFLFFGKKHSQAETLVLVMHEHTNKIWLHPTDLNSLITKINSRL